MASDQSHALLRVIAGLLTTALEQAIASDDSLLIALISHAHAVAEERLAEQ